MKTLANYAEYDIKTLVTEEVIEGQLRVIYADESAYLDALVASAWAHVEDYTGVKYGTTTMSFETDSIKSQFELPVDGDRLSAITVQYWDGSAYNTVASDMVYNSTIGFPTVITVDTEDAAYDSADTDGNYAITKGTATIDARTPEKAVQMAFLMLLMHFYQNREAVTLAGKPEEMPMGVRSLLTPYKKGIVR